MIKYREIKFRAWDIKNERMVYDPFQFTTYWEDRSKYLVYEDWRDHDDGESFIGYIMQYTGMKDIEDRKIYEGDIVKSTIHNPCYYLIEFIEGGFCATHPKIKGYPIDINHFDGKFKVVGNIFEHSDLLK